MNLAFLLSPLPLVLLAASFLIIHHSRKPIHEWWGKLPFSLHPFSFPLRATLLSLVALLAIGVGIDFLATQLHINDT
ncbi:MAG: hypothetical protein AABY11_02160, partial [archaeon]